MKENRTEIPGLYKDEQSGALINKDNASLLAYKKRKEMDRRIQSIEKRLEHVEKLLKVFETRTGDNR
jgi:hypothetical protein